MDGQRFDGIAKSIASGADRRSVLKRLGLGGLAAAGALAGAAALKPQEAEAGLITIVIFDVLNNVTVNVEVKNNNVAVQVCAVVELLSAQLPGTDLTCTIIQ